ncbi:MAG: PD-(D/E)XK nuclease family protein [Prevotella sp.]|nr:PD-(D/E)XK nuclease family protein [Prevotella sp.]
MEVFRNNENTMKPFLKIVAEDLIRKYGNSLSRIAVIFPNKRASLFLDEHMARLSGKPMWSPSYFTISDFFHHHSSFAVGDDIKLICTLYQSFKERTNTAETLDHFYGWGQVLLADFDDIDKSMADAGKIFANLKDIHELDGIPYLNGNQKETLKKFFQSFTDGHESELKRRFLELWSCFGDIYNDFKQRLRKQGIAYEGMIFRDVAEQDTAHTAYEKYIFVGFNVLQEVERHIFAHLKKEGKACFYWDFDTYYMKGQHEAGHYIRRFLQEFPNELDPTNDNIYNHLSDEKQIAFISAPTEDVQARYITHWLRHSQRTGAGKRTAIILCNENLLQTAIHCIPEDAGQLNITMGFPLFNTPICSFIQLLTDIHLFPSKTTVRKIQRHPYAAYFRSKTEGKAPHLSPIPPKDINSNQEFVKWLKRIVKYIAQIMQREDGVDDFRQESLFCVYTLLNRIDELIASQDLQVNVVTLQRLLLQLMRSQSIPFHGEPVVGIQIMGVLETRNLDFDHVLMLSCNEGNMPKGINESSFIPYSIRKAFGLATVENKMAMFSYHFYHILQRAKDITITYNNSTEDGHTGEMSRFMLQLMVESKTPIHRQSLQAGQKQIPIRPKQVEKSGAIMEKLREMRDNCNLYPTSINRYLRCPLQFFFNDISDIKEPDNEDEDEIDNRMFGNIFHRAAELIYPRIKNEGKVILPGDIEDILKDGHTVPMTVDQAIREKMFNGAEMMPELNGQQIINREVIIRYIERLLIIDSHLAPFSIIGTEKKVGGNISITTTEGRHSIRLSGYIDRLDRIEENGVERIRVVDYKTGSHSLTSKINTVEEIFQQPILKKKHPDYYLQTMLYAQMVSNSHEYNEKGLPISPALLFIQHASVQCDPTISIGKERISDIKAFEETFVQHVSKVLSDMFEPTLPFAPTEDKEICVQCPYKIICGI